MSSRDDLTIKLRCDITCKKNSSNTKEISNFIESLKNTIEFLSNSKSKQQNEERNTKEDQ